METELNANFKVSHKGIYQFNSSASETNDSFLFKSNKIQMPNRFSVAIYSPFEILSAKGRRFDFTQLNLIPGVEKDQKMKLSLPILLSGE